MEGLVSPWRNSMPITNNETENRLEVSVNGGLGVLRYRIQGDTIWLLHVQVPRSTGAWRC